MARGHQEAEKVVIPLPAPSLGQRRESSGAASHQPEMGME